MAEQVTLDARRREMRERFRRLHLKWARETELRTIRWESLVCGTSPRIRKLAQEHLRKCRLGAANHRMEAYAVKK